MSFDARAALVLTQKKVVDAVLKNGLQVKMSDARDEAASGRHQRDLSLYDTQLSAAGGYNRDKSDQAIAVFGTDNKSQTLDLSVTQLLPTGTRVGLSYNHLWQKTDSPFATLNPYFETAAMLSVRQPLLNNLLGRNDRGFIEASKLKLESRKTLSRHEKERAAFSAILVYWEWIVRRNNEALLSQSLQEAIEFEDLTKASGPFGVYDLNDLLNATANRLRYEQQLSFARQMARESRYQLLTLLNLGLETEIISRETPAWPSKARNSDAVLATALENRGDYRAALLQAESGKIGVAMAENGLLPRFDLVANVKLNGIEGDYDRSLREVTDADHPDYFIGGEVSFPLQNRFARGRKTESRADSTLALLKVRQLRNEIAKDVATLIGAVSEQSKQVALAGRLQDTTRRNWRVELDQYKNGKSRGDLVVRAQEEYLEAARNLLANLLAYRVSFTQLQLTQGILIESFD